ncbi:MAG: hypothetical protein LBL96_12540 [Clostridiales bacterium]|jgi:hypothetical protein|nr:hypothetical protein [Clostridiales bacterium]
MATVCGKYFSPKPLTNTMETVINSLETDKALYFKAYRNIKSILHREEENE